MKQILTLLALAFALLVGLNCGSTEDLDENVGQVDEVEALKGTLQGEVHAIDGVTIQVRLLKAGQLVSQTEAAGSYELSELDEGDYTVQITAKGYETAEITANVIAGENVSLDKVTLVVLAEPVSHLRGILSDIKTRSSLSDVLVKLMDKTGEQYEALTNKDGVFTFENLPIDQAFTMTVAHAGYEDSEIAIAPISADQTFKLDLELTALLEPEKLDPGQGLSIGSQAPEFELPDSNDTKHVLADYTANKNVVVIFYRGGW